MRFSSSEQNHAIFGRQDAEFEQLKKERDELSPASERLAPRPRLPSDLKAMG